MSKNKYDEFYSKFSVSELFEKLRGFIIEPNAMEKDWFDALIIHLEHRHLSIEDERILRSILPAEYTDLKEDEGRQEKLIASTSSKERESGRYTALETVAGLMSPIGIIVIVIGVCVFFAWVSEKQTLFGSIALVVSFIIALPLFAFSNLIYVFIDIEYNTRKTTETLNENKK